MNKKKISLESLKVESFVTNINSSSENTVKGGGASDACVTVNGCLTNPNVSCTGCQTVAGVMAGCGGGGSFTRPPLKAAPNRTAGEAS